MLIDIGLSEDQVLELVSGEVVRIPFEGEASGKVSLHVKSGIMVHGYKQLDIIQGGTLGIIVDVRGRPLPSLHGEDLYEKSYRHWYEALL